MKRNPSMSTWLILGALGAGAYAVVKHSRGMAEPKVNKMRPAVPKPAIPKPAAASPRYVFAEVGKETLCWDNQDKKWVPVSHCEALHVLEGFGADPVAEFAAQQRAQEEAASSRLDTLTMSIGIGAAAAEIDQHILKPRKHGKGFLKRYDRRYGAIFGAGFVVSEIVLKAVKGQL